MLKISREEYQSRDYEFDEIEDDPRLVRAKKEMIITDKRAGSPSIYWREECELICEGPAYPFRFSS